jgi:uncharacterized surface protein with fasciclin (FAS1) repeats
MIMWNMLAIGTAVLGVAVGASNAAAVDTPTKDIVDTAVAAGSFTTLAKALAAAGLVETLKGAGPFTVFAPTDEAFGKIPPAMLTTATKDAATLKKVLTYHVIEGQLTPEKVKGMHKTLEGDTVTVTGAGDALKVNGTNVICGGVKTANATVYMIDGVLLPKS